MRWRPTSLAMMLAWGTACDRSASEPEGLSSASPRAEVSVVTPAVSSAPDPLPPPVRMETVPVPGDWPAYVLRGARGARKMVFLHGTCTNGLGYAQSFQHAAARQGWLVAVQADKPCKNTAFHDWTNTPEELDARIEAAFRAAGYQGPLEDLTVIGYSSGAVLSTMLAHKYPRRYAYVILIGGPQKPTEWRLRNTRSTVMMAGSRDRQDLMKDGARDLDAAGIPSKFMILPGAQHGQMGSESERVMGEALDWLFAHARPR